MNFNLIKSVQINGGMTLIFNQTNFIKINRNKT